MLTEPMDDVDLIALVRVARAHGAVRGSLDESAWDSRIAETLKSWRERTTPEAQEAELAAMRDRVRAELAAADAERKQRAIATKRRAELIRELRQVTEHTGHVRGNSALRDALATAEALA